MKPRKAEQIPQADMFRLRLDQMLNQRHALYKLSSQIDWNAAEVHFGHLYSEEGRPGIPIRLMVGLHYLKHTYDLSDEEVVAQWAENPPFLARVFALPVAAGFPQCAFRRR
jgi:IS5 family transposase